MSEKCTCGGFCIEKIEVSVMSVPNGTDQMVQVKYYVCLVCGKEHQTEKQQAEVMLEMYHRIPEDEYDEQDRYMITSLKEVVGEPKGPPRE